MAEQEEERKNAEEKSAIELKAKLIEFQKLLTENGFTATEDKKQFKKGRHAISVEKLYAYTKEQLIERFTEIEVLIEADNKIAETTKQMAEQQRILEEKEKAEKEAEKAPILDKLNLWVDNVVIASPPIENEATIEIMKRFEGFKSWAKQVINK